MLEPCGQSVQATDINCIHMGTVLQTIAYLYSPEYIFLYVLQEFGLDLGIKNERFPCTVNVD